jgi:phosphoglycolate phosphatase
MRLVLFDIDGTLIASGRGPKRAFSRAVREVCDVPVQLTYEIAAGNTDPGILQHVLTEAGLTTAEIDDISPKVFERHLELLNSLYNKDGDAVMFDGVQPLLARLAGNSEVLLALLTGNMERGARIKLSPFDINHYFDFGAYGSDDANRDLLPAIAVQRASERTGLTFAGADVVVVGDTIKDIQCARVIGARSVIVVRHPSQDAPVRDAAPEVILEDFLDTDLVEQSILTC